MTDDLAVDVMAFRRWAHWYAGRITNPYQLLYDDVVQEGLIEAWRVLGVKGGRENVSATYLTKSMRRRMLDVTHGRPMVGGNRRPGPRTEPTIVHSLDAMLAVDDGETLSAVRSELLHGPDLLDGIEIAYHDGCLAEALAALTPADRQYVVLRFWHGMTDTEIATRQAVTKQHVWQRWRRTIKPRLREHLACLVDSGY